MFLKVYSSLIIAMKLHPNFCDNLKVICVYGKMLNLIFVIVDQFFFKTLSLFQIVGRLTF